METNKKVTQSEESDEAATRLLGSSLGGAMLGGSIAGPPGAIVVGIFGFILGWMTNQSHQKQGKPK